MDIALISLHVENEAIDWRGNIQYPARCQACIGKILAIRGQEVAWALQAYLRNIELRTKGLSKSTVNIRLSRRMFIPAALH
ncbi:MAG: hypothetical protein E5Y52_16460 [Mesorhizobium sp.]|nr:MAG: hypothetical protein E5Y52_16460 [Mesorhizobium sp.]